MLRAAVRTIQYIGQVSGNNSTVGSLALSVPTGTQTGDLLVAFGYSASAGSSWSATGGGWTITNGTNTTAPRLTAFYRVADATTSFTFAQNSGTADIGVTLMTFRNASFDVVSTLATAADPIVIPSVTASLNNSMQVITAGGNTNYPASTPSGFTQVYLDNGGGNQPDYGVYYKEKISAGATGTVSVDMTGSANTSGMQIVLKLN